LRGYLDWITQAEDIEPDADDKDESSNQQGKLLFLILLYMNIIFIYS